MIKIPLTRGYIALIDDGDAELVGGYRWRVLVQPHTCYAIARLPRRGGKQRTQYLQHLVVNAGPSERVEHVDRNGLMNCRANLRIHSVGLGAMWPASGRPSSRQEGVTWDAEAGKWSASFDDEEGRKIRIGLFDTEWRAILRHDFALMREHGLVPRSVSFERFLAWRPSVPKGSLYDLEHMMEQARRERGRRMDADPTARRRDD